MGAHDRPLLPAVGADGAAPRELPADLRPPRGRPTLPPAPRSTPRPPPAAAAAATTAATTATAAAWRRARRWRRGCSHSTRTWRRGSPSASASPSRRSDRSSPSRTPRSSACWRRASSPPCWRASKTSVRSARCRGRPTAAASARTLLRRRSNGRSCCRRSSARSRCCRTCSRTARRRSSRVCRSSCRCSSCGCGRSARAATRTRGSEDEGRLTPPKEGTGAGAVRQQLLALLANYVAHCAAAKCSLAAYSDAKGRSLVALLAHSVSRTPRPTQTPPPLAQWNLSWAVLQSVATAPEGRAVLLRARSRRRPPPPSAASSAAKAPTTRAPPPSPISSPTSPSNPTAPRRSCAHPRPSTRSSSRCAAATPAAGARRRSRCATSPSAPMARRRSSRRRRRSPRSSARSPPTTPRSPRARAAGAVWALLAKCEREGGAALVGAPPAAPRGRDDPRRAHGAPRRGGGAARRAGAQRGGRDLLAAGRRPMKGWGPDECVCTAL